ncbi:MAG TPA: nickel pincer cofactor biosynthesis protein LarB [Vicinamibacterales bacterium]|nr:nickel pincer cofactor biosynthesis protein LarB [Vicinamibacterales bacterium]
MANPADQTTRPLDALRALFDAVRDGRLDPAEAERRAEAFVARDPFEDLGFARVDHHRASRQGFPEVVFGQGKTPDQIARIARAIVDRGHSLLITRTSAEAFDRVGSEVPDATFHHEARIIERRVDGPRGRGVILVAAAGTSDLPVAEEAAVSAEVMGNDVDRLYDVGVAGLHRLLSERARLDAARVIIAVAGMEGALASVIGGLVRVPVVAVPTSVGYGSSFGGMTALLAMLNSCATGISVVNIDNGFGAASVASAINHLA